MCVPDAAWCRGLEEVRQSCSAMPGPVRDPHRRLLRAGLDLERDRHVVTAHLHGVEEQMEDDVDHVALGRVRGDDVGRRAQRDRPLALAEARHRRSLLDGRTEIDRVRRIAARAGLREVREALHDALDPFGALTRVRKQHRRLLAQCSQRRRQRIAQRRA
jgi:hypothetical protein